MQVTFNPVNYQNKNAYNNNSQIQRYNSKQQTQTFTSNPLNAGEELIGNLSGKSRIFDPLLKIWDDVIEAGAKYVVAPFLDLKPIRWFADKTKDSNNMVNHLNVVSSAMISGMYVKKTLDNKKLDEDKRSILALNQALVFGVSTAGMYLLDGSLNNWWNNTVTPKYASVYLKQPDLAKNFKAANDAILEENKKLAPELQKKAVKLFDYIKKELKLDSLEVENLNTRLKGMDMAKKLFVFTLVYRYLAPILVTPLANKLGDKILEHKRSKKAAEQAQLNIQPTQYKISA